MLSLKLLQVEKNLGRAKATLLRKKGGSRIWASSNNCTDKQDSTKVLDFASCFTTIYFTLAFCMYSMCIRIRHPFGMCQLQYFKRVFQEVQAWRLFLSILGTKCHTWFSYLSYYKTTLPFHPFYEAHEFQNLRHSLCD